jgi:hypothetical protein
MFVKTLGYNLQNAIGIQQKIIVKIAVCFKKQTSPLSSPGKKGCAAKKITSPKSSPLPTGRQVSKERGRWGEVKNGGTKDNSLQQSFRKSQ